MGEIAGAFHRWALWTAEGGQFRSGPALRSPAWREAPLLTLDLPRWYLRFSGS